MSGFGKQISADSVFLYCLSRWEDNIKKDLREVEWEAWTGSIWLWIGTGSGLF